ncbi:MAG TPA: TetR/AcrR family transcriptional regulator [Bacillota bacterium]
MEFIDQPTAPEVAPHQAFLSLPPDKQEAIRQACLKEFVDHGYHGASTNHIHEAAGISKGLIFHYFGSKKNLFLYLFDRTLEYFWDRMVGSGVADWPKDVFERISLLSLQKVRLFEENPLYYRFVFEGQLNFPKGLEAEMAERTRATTQRGYAILFKDIDLSTFRPDIDPQKAIEVVVITMNGLADKYLGIIRRSQDPDRALRLTEGILGEFREYQRILKLGMCRPEPARPGSG